MFALSSIVKFHQVIVIKLLYKTDNFTWLIQVMFLIPSKFQLPQTIPGRARAFEGPDGPRFEAPESAGRVGF